MITVRGWHGTLSLEKSKRMDSIAMPIKPRFEWEFEGSVGDFAEKWELPFIAYPLDKPKKDEFAVRWRIFISDYPSWQAR